MRSPAVATVRVEIEHAVEGVEPDRALAWWTDFREGRADHSFVPGARRRVTELGGGARIHDRVVWLGIPVFSERVEARTRGNTVQLVGENTFARFEARYLFEHAFDPDGTRLTLTGRIELKGLLSWLDRLARPIVVRVLAWDTVKHLEQMREQLAGAR